MASKELLDRAMQTFERLDDFGKGITMHAMRVHSVADLRDVFSAQDDFHLEHIIIEEMEYDLPPQPQ